ncbi:MAG: hypothetical protein ACLR8Y_22530 [Alistipes indistinctus]
MTAPGREAARKILPKGIARALNKERRIRLYRLIISVRCNGAAVTSVPVLAEYLRRRAVVLIRRVARCWPLGTPAARALGAEDQPDDPLRRPGGTDCRFICTSAAQKESRPCRSCSRRSKTPTARTAMPPLRFIQPYLGEPVYNALVKELKEAKPEVKSDIITYLGLQNAQSALPAILLYHRRC